MEDFIRARCHVYDMMKDRGYTLKGVKREVKEIKEVEELDFVCYNGKEEVRVCWYSTKFCVGNVRNLLASMEEEDFFHAIVICEQSTKQTTSNLRNQKYQIELFVLSQVLFNPTKHEFVPKHELCTQAEIKELLAAYGGTIANFPKIFDSDPIARYYGAKKGDVFRITANSDCIDGTAIRYRTVVKGVFKTKGKK